jgi:uncharacterized protein (TIGR01777 family)
MKSPAVIFGANGFLGRYLCHALAAQGREVVAVARHREGVVPEAMFLEWDGKTPGPWALALEGAGLVVNLAGRSVNCRYDEAHRREILESRVDSTRVIGEAIAACREAPEVWMNASTATWYRHAEDAPQDEWRGEPGEGFSVSVARQWEEAFFAAPTPGRTRKIALRTAMVLAAEPETVFEVLGGLVKRGLGGAMAGGRQRVSWIHMDDFLAAIEFLENQPLAEGVFNLSAPQAPINRDWMRAFREVLAMPVGLSAPRWALEIGARTMDTEVELVAKSRWVEPRRLAETGFRWRWPELLPALTDLRERGPIERFFRVPEKRAIGARAWVTDKGLRPASRGKVVAPEIC